MSWRKRCRRFVAVALVLAGMGCSPTLHLPRLAHPGPAPFQRSNAVQFDPYPQDDVGPAIVGGRPRDYAKPLDEVTRARQHNPSIPSSPSSAPGGWGLPEGGLAPPPFIPVPQSIPPNFSSGSSPNFSPTVPPNYTPTVPQPYSQVSPPAYSSPAYASPNPPAPPSYQQAPLPGYQPTAPPTFTPATPLY